MVGNSRVPSYEELVGDLHKVRERGIGRLRGLDVPALGNVARIVASTDIDGTEPAAITAVLRSAVDTLGGGSLQESAEYLLGLYPGTALWNGKMRRDEAAQLFGLVGESFRKKPEKALLGQIAEAVLASCHDANLRQVRLDMEQRRHPADSRLAVQWVERFEAYYRIWTPAYALGENLQAALDTYLEEPSDHLPWDPDSAVAYDPVRQARGYARSALYNLAQFHLELKRFMSKHGGLWLLSDADVEQNVADAVYRIGWHNSLNDEDESFLRRHLADSRHEETEHFWNVIQGFPQGLRIHDRWQDMVRDGVGLTTDKQKVASQVWLTIAACRDYVRIIDEDWLRIADWYRPGITPDRRVNGARLYDDLLREKGSEGSHAV
jgi:hypothetical protein